MRLNSYAVGAEARPAAFRIIKDKTRGVVAYNEDPEQEGRPLLLMMSGAGIALLSLMFIGVLCLRSFYEHRIDTNDAYLGISLLFCFYVLGVFLFCYAFELYDMPKALRLTIIAAFVSLVFLVLVIVSLSTLAKVKDGVGALTEEADSAGDGSLARTLFSYAGINSRSDADETPRRRLGSFEPDVKPPLPPFLFRCRGCNEMFTPKPPDAVCPFCSKAALSG